MTLYTCKLDEMQIQKLGDWLEFHQWESYIVDYAQFAYRSPGINIVVYKTGKVMFQGKKTEEFVKFTLEPEITHALKLGYDEINHPEWFREHGGLDESGKGDLFGPLVSACVIADGDAVRQWIKAGVKDSKLIKTDRQIFALENVIRSTEHVVVEVFMLSMRKYNELYNRFGENMNRLLAWYHSKSLANALQKNAVAYVLLDQFTRQPLVQNYFKNDPVEIDMRPKAEEDPLVAAASIVARAEFIRAMERLSEDAGEVLLRGAGETVLLQAKGLVRRLGSDCLPEFAKMHFSTAQKALWG